MKKLAGKSFKRVVDRHSPYGWSPFFWALFMKSQVIDSQVSVNSEETHEQKATNFRVTLLD